MSQNKREYSMMKFRKNQADILVATDVAARGIDVPRVGLVVNYDVPNQDMVYFHRIGRTARAGAKGKAITLVSYSSIADWKFIKKQIKSDLTDLNKTMGIEVHIPDPLKRDVGRRIAQPMRSGYGRRPSYGGRSRPSYGGGGRSSYGGQVMVAVDIVETDLLEINTKEEEVHAHHMEDKTAIPKRNGNLTLKDKD